MSLPSTPKRRLIALVAAAAIVAAGSGLAYAFWTGGGTGSGSATTGNSAGFTITVDPPTGTPLVPGGSAQSVGFTIANPAATAQSLTSLVVTVAQTTDGSPWTAVAGCSSLDYTVGTPVVTYGEINGGANVTGTVTITMNDLASNQDACQGVTVPLYFLAS